MLMRKGFRFFNKQQYKDAITFFERSQKEFIDLESLSTLWAGLSLAELGFYDLAEEKINSASTQMPDNQIIQAFQAQIYLDQNKLDMVEEQLRALGPEDKANSSLVKMLQGIFYLKMGEMKKASELISSHSSKLKNAQIQSRILLACEEYLQSYPYESRHIEEVFTNENYPQSFITKIYMNLKLMRLSIRYLFNPNQQKAQKYARAGDLFNAKRDWKQGIEQYELALEATPTDSTIFQELVMTCICGREYKKAKELIKKSSSFQKKDDRSTFNFLKGILLLRTRSYSKARTIFNQLRHEGLENPFIDYYLGICDLNEDQVLSARQHFVNLNEEIIADRLNEALRVFQLVSL